MKSLQVVVVLGIFLGFVAAVPANSAAKNAPIFKECTGGDKGSAKITDVRIFNCDQPPCILKKGTNVSVEMDFVPKDEIDKATTKVTAKIVGVDVPFPMKDPNACESMTCPIKPGTATVYKTTLPVLTTYPSITVIVKWKVVKEDNSPITCFLSEVKIE